MMVKWVWASARKTPSEVPCGYATTGRRRCLLSHMIRYSDAARKIYLIPKDSQKQHGLMLFVISSILVLKSVSATIGVTVEPNLFLLVVMGHESRIAGL